MIRKVCFCALTLMMLGLILAACTPEVAPTPTPEPTATATAAPTATPEPTPTTVPPTPTVEATPTELPPTPTEAPTATAEPSPTQPPEEDPAALGEPIYADNCAVCHGQAGQGVPGAYPALAGSTFVTAEDPVPLTQVLLDGRRGMPSFGNRLSDAEIAAVISYIRTTWGNDASIVTAEQVGAAR